MNRTAIAAVTLSLLGCDTKDITEIPGVAEVMGVTTNPQQPSPEITDPCCYPGESGKLMDGQCEDELVFENVCARAPICCDTSWYPQCASAYATYASSCATLPEAGAGSSASSGGGGSYTPPADIQQSHPPIQIQLYVELGSETESDVGGNLFLAGFSEVEEHTGRPARDVRPVHYTQLKTFMQEWPFEASVEVYTGLYYWAMYGTGEHPGPGDRMSELTQVESESGELKLIVGTEQIPAGGGGQPPGSTEGGTQ